MRRLGRGVGLLGLAITAACASGSGRSANTTTVLVRVENAAGSADSLTVWMAPLNGSRRSLGAVAPASTRLLRVDGVNADTEYRLTAERPSGASVSSQPFRPQGTDLVDWDLAANVLQLLRVGVP